MEWQNAFEWHNNKEIKAEIPGLCILLNDNKNNKNINLRICASRDSQFYKFD
jgi:hypothetical protein